MKCCYFGSNNNFGVFHDKTLSWEGIDSQTGKAITPKPSNIAEALNSVLEAFSACYGEGYMNNIKASIVPCAECPTSFANMNIVGLEVRGRDWRRYIFQFAHELCHLTIGNDVPSTIRWFEESICALASLFFTIKVGYAWEVNPPYLEWQGYYSNILTYITNMITTTPVTVPKNETFASFFSKQLEFLASHYYERDINRLCAIYLLPIFNKTPALWKDVPLISKLNEEDHFYTALLQWREISQAKDAVNEIVNLFTHEIPSSP
jgi:hypothetical protein